LISIVWSWNWSPLVHVPKGQLSRETHPTNRGMSQVQTHNLENWSAVLTRALQTIFTAHAQKVACCRLISMCLHLNCINLIVCVCVFTSCIDVLRQSFCTSGLRSLSTTVVLPTAAKCRSSCEYCLLIKQMTILTSSHIQETLKSKDTTRTRRCVFVCVFV